MNLVEPNVNLTFNHPYGPLPLATKKVNNQIHEFKPHLLIFWYISPDGLKNLGVGFYKRNFFTCPQLSTACCKLWDLTAWKILNNQNSLYSSSISEIQHSIDSHSEFVEKINQLSLERFQCLKASSFFSWIRSENNANIIQYVHTILARKQLLTENQDRFSTGKKIKDIFGESSEMLKPIWNDNCDQAYPALRYLEGIYLINEMAIEQLQKSQDKEIRMGFVLPNDESKCYYFPAAPEMMTQDVSTIFRMKTGEKSEGKNLIITFFSFQYGELEKRPYLEGKNVTTIRRSYFENV